MNIARNVVAVDLGAESGRLVLCRWNGSEGTLEEIHRFPNGATAGGQPPGVGCRPLYGRKSKGACRKRPPKRRATLIAWAWMDGEWITLCLMPRASALATPIAIAMPATCPPWRRRFSTVPQERMYEITGIQFLSFNTVYQLVAHVAEFPEEWERAARWLTLPEYFQYRLTGVIAAEYTEASTTQLLDVRTRSWSARADLRARARPGEIPAHRAGRDGVGKASPGSQRGSWAWRTPR